MNATPHPIVAVPAAILPKCPCKTTAECINWRYRQANEHAAIAIMAAIDAGRQLVAVKSRMPHGTWEKWIAANLEFTDQTARNLMKMYAKSVGAERAALPEPVGPDTPVSEDEFAAAREKYPATSPAAFLKALSGDRSSNWGGDRRAAAAANGNRVGRPPETADRNKIRADAIFSKERIGELADAVLQKRLHLYVSDPDRRAVILAVAKQLVQDFE